MTNLKPWYININPGAYVPTFLVKDNVPVCESAVIIKYIEEKFEGTACLLPDDKIVQERFKQIYDLHEDWDVESYTFASI